MNDLDLERLACRLDAAARAYYHDFEAGAALAFHAAKSALLAAVSRQPGMRWWRGRLCYEATATGLLVWSTPGLGPRPPRRRRRRGLQGPLLFSGPGVLCRVGKPLYVSKLRSGRVSA